nr:MAG TPA: hypothetical protein [Caudoviricetes sp.]
MSFPNIYEKRTLLLIILFSVSYLQIKLYNYTILI